MCVREFRLLAARDSFDGGVNQGECQRGIDVKPIHQGVVVVQELTYVTWNETLGMATVSFF